MARYIPNASFWLTAMCIDLVDLSYISFPALKCQNAHNTLEPWKYSDICFHNFSYLGSTRTRKWHFPLARVSCWILAELWWSRAECRAGAAWTLRLNTASGCWGLQSPIHPQPPLCLPCSAISINEITANTACVQWALLPLLGIFCCFYLIMRLHIWFLLAPCPRGQRGAPALPSRKGSVLPKCSIGTSNLLVVWH